VQMKVLSQVLFPFFMAFLVIFGILSFAVGVGLIVASPRMLRLFERANRWISTREKFAVLEKSRNIAPFFNKHRRWFGAIFILGGLYALYGLAFDSKTVMLALRMTARYAYAIGVFETLRWLLVAGSILAIAVGALLIWAPRLLDAVAARADQWYAPKFPAERADAMHMPLDRLVQTYPRAAGWIIALCAGVVVVVAWTLWLKMPW
jgi:hypothetical protein